MSSRRYRALLLDVMSTLVYEPFFEEVPGFFGLSLPELLPLLRKGAWVDFELDKIDEATFFGRFFADGRSFDGPGLRDAMVDAYAWLDGIEELLGELQAAGIEMHLLSNYPRWYQLIEQKLGLSRYAKWSFVSCDMGVRKPDLAAYLGPARQLGADPKQLLFVDDRASNCAAAREAGMDAIVFHGAAALREELIKRRLLR